MNIDVFISHSSKDAKIANAICNTLEANNIRCWLAPRDIRPGSDWAESINNAIKNSSFIKYNEKISGDYSEVENFYFDKM